MQTLLRHNVSGTQKNVKANFIATKYFIIWKVWVYESDTNVFKVSELEKYQVILGFLKGIHDLGNFHYIL